QRAIERELIAIARRKCHDELGPGTTDLGAQILGSARGVTQTSPGMHHLDGGHLSHAPCSQTSQTAVWVGPVTGRCALLERLTTSTDVDALDGAKPSHVPGRVLSVTRQTGRLARALDALARQVTDRALRARRIVRKGASPLPRLASLVEPPRSRMDEVDADVDRALELEPERRVATGACGAIGVGMQHGVECRRTAVTAVAGPGVQDRVRALGRSDLDLDRSRERDVLAQV